MTKSILIQLDCDNHPSSFDSVVALDAGVDHLLRYASVEPVSVTSIVHGAMFTRGGEELKKTAIFIGGGDVAAAEAVFRSVQNTFFGPVRVSVMLDANGCNTTAAAAVVSAAKHVDLAKARTLVLGGTGPVGRRVARLLASEGALVQLSSRSQSRAEQVCNEISQHLTSPQITPLGINDGSTVESALEGCEVVIACGAAGVEFATQAQLVANRSLRVAIDLNAVPPSGLGGISVADKAKPISGSTEGAVGYGAIGVGGLKMKTHRAAIRSLFEAKDRVLDADEIYAIAKSI